MSEIIERMKWANELYEKACNEAIESYKRKLIEACEMWCGMHTYIDEKICDEHDCDDSQGRQRSADELLDFIKTWEPREK